MLWDTDNTLLLLLLLLSHFSHVQPCVTHRQQPTRLLCLWDSPGKNTGVGCHFLLQCMGVNSESEVAQSCLTLCDPTVHQSTRLLHPWDFPGKSTGVGLPFPTPDNTLYWCFKMFHSGRYSLYRKQTVWYIPSLNFYLILMYSWIHLFIWL